MSGCLGTANKGIAMILAVLLVVIMPFALLAWDVGRVFFNPPLVKEILIDEVVHTDLVPVTLEWFSKNAVKERAQGYDASSRADEPDILAMLALIDRNDWRRITAEVLPPEVLSDWIMVTVDGLYAWINSGDAVPRIIWDMDPIKARLSSQNGVNVMMLVYNKLPLCTERQINEFARRLAVAPRGEKVEYSLCKFPNVYQGKTVGWLDDQAEGFINSLDPVVQNVPSRLNLVEALGQGENTQNSEDQGGKALLRAIRSGMRLSWLLVAVLLVLILLLVVRSTESLARWWGIPLLISGFFTLLPGLAYHRLVTNALANAQLPDLQPVVIEEIHRVSIRMADAAFRPLVFQAIILSITGIALLVWLFIQKRQSVPNLSAISTESGGSYE